MRITTGMTAESAVYNLQMGRGSLEKLQERLSSGIMVNRPSDNPLTARQLLSLKSEIQVGDQYTSNVDKASLHLGVISTALQGMSSLMQQVKKVAGDMLNGTIDAGTINGATSNLKSLKQQIIDLGNTRLGNQYVFAGFGDTQPFDSSGAFSGTDDALDIKVGSGSQIAANVTGGTLLRGGTPPAPVGSGATAGQGPIDVLGSIDALISAISSSDKSAIADGIKNVKTGGEQLVDAQSDVAGRMVRLEGIKNRLAYTKNTLSGIYDQKQAVDLAKTGVELNQQTTAFTAALSTTAKLTQLTLLDFMK